MALPEIAKGLRFQSGKFEDRLMTDIALQYPNYIVWCWKNVSTRMGIPYELYAYAMESISKSKERKRADAAAAEDFGGDKTWLVPPPPGWEQPPEHPRCRGVYVGSDNVVRKVYGPATTYNPEHAQQWLKSMGYSEGDVVQLENGTRIQITGPNEYRALSKEEEFPGEPSIFQEMLEETGDNSTSFLDGIL